MKTCLTAALWLKKHNYECESYRTSASPMCNATSMYYSETNPLKRVKIRNVKMFHNAEE
ncbi:hypothetical protein O9993_11050 [Vibrio lentus]|nr:hypothetical protein [Vibrio lentus]